MLQRKIGTFFLVLGLSFLPSAALFASTTDGTIDSTNKYAKTLDSNGGTLNFGTAQGNVHVTDAALTGYAWGDVLGWVNLAPTFGGVTNTAEGALSGYAWGELTGWINFAPSQGGVTINSSGDFLGYAWSQNFGWIIFNCATNSSCGTQNFKVATDWRPASVRNAVVAACTNGSDDDGDGKTDYPTDPGCSSSADTDETDTPSGGGAPGSVVPVPPTPVTPPVTPPEPTTPPPTIEPSTPPPTNPTAPATGGTGTDPGAGSGTGGSNGGSGFGGTSGGSGGGIISPVIPAETPSIFNAAVNQIRESFKATSDAVSAVRERTKEILQDPTASAVTKTVSTVGVVTGGATAVSTLFLNPLTFSEIILIPLRLWTLLLSALGLKKRYKPWGTVYDSVTKQPLDPAYVVLEDMNGNEVETSITDLDGRYGFLLSAGSYKIIANKTNYIFPSKKLSGRAYDELYSNLYFGESIVANEAGEIIVKNIPMDPEQFDWNEFAKQNKKLTKYYSKRDVWITKISNFFFVFGFLIAIVAFLVAPEPYNILIFALYLGMLALRIFGFKPKTFGVLTEKATGDALSFAIVRIHSVLLGREMLHKVSDKFGRYYCLVPEGDYFVQIDKKNADESYTQVFKSEVMYVKKGVINKNFQI